MFYSDQYAEVNYSIEACSEGASPEFCISSSTRTDVCLCTLHRIKIWGQLLASHKIPLAHVSICLVRINTYQETFTCSYVTETTTDTNGFYLIDVDNQPSACYHLVVFEPHSAYNKVLNTSLNHCLFHYAKEMPCQHALLSYLNVTFPYSFTGNQVKALHLDSSYITKIYAIPCYRQ